MKSRKNETGPTAESDLRAAVARFQQDEALLDALRRIYADAERAVAEIHGADGGHRRCLRGGACCKFDVFGHLLYLTVVELALLVQTRPPRPERASEGRCPYELAGRCTAYDRRPLGCRTFFCRDETNASVREAHERFHRALRDLHERRCIPYAYADLLGFILQLFAGK
jgi:hypothetical protein